MLAGLLLSDSFSQSHVDGHGFHIGLLVESLVFLFGIFILSLCVCVFSEVHPVFLFWSQHMQVSRKGVC